MAAVRKEMIPTFSRNIKIYIFIHKSISGIDTFTRTLNLGLIRLYVKITHEAINDCKFNDHDVTWLNADNKIFIT